MATFFKRSHAGTATLSAPTLPQATTDPCLRWRLLDIHGQVWVSPLWGHCFFLLGPGVHKVLFVPFKSLFPQSCVSSGGSMVGFMATSSKKAYAISRSAAQGLYQLFLAIQQITPKLSCLKQQTFAISWILWARNLCLMSLLLGLSQGCNKGAGWDFGLL